MKKFLAALLIGLSLVSITLDASAARLGGGAKFRSFYERSEGSSFYSLQSSFRYCH